MTPSYPRPTEEGGVDGRGRADHLNGSVHLGSQDELAGLGVVRLAEQVGAEAALHPCRRGPIDGRQPGAEHFVELSAGKFSTWPNGATWS